MYRFGGLETQFFSLLLTPSTFPSANVAIFTIHVAFKASKASEISKRVGRKSLRVHSSMDKDRLILRILVDVVV
jgi:hypothetical protein